MAHKNKGDVTVLYHKITGILDGVEGRTDGRTNRDKQSHLNLF